MLGLPPNSPALSAGVDDFVSLPSPSFADAAVAQRLSSDPYIQNEEFSLRGADVKLVAEKTFFCVHTYLFERESKEASALVSQNRDGGHIVISDIKAIDLTRFLRVLYCRITDEPPLTSNDEWMSALALAHRWNFASIRTLALRKLLPLTSPVDQIVLANQYNIDAWKPAAYRQLCEQAFWPSPDDCQRLGLDELIKFGQGWHAMRASTTLIPPSDRDALVTRMFNLPRDEASDEVRRLRSEVEGLAQQRLDVEAKAQDAQRQLRAAEEAERVRRICEAEAAADALAVRALEEAERTRAEAEAEADRRRIEDERARVLAERAELERRVQSMDATAAELARKADETRRAHDQSEGDPTIGEPAVGEPTVGEPAIEEPTAPVGQAVGENTTGGIDNLLAIGLNRAKKSSAGKKGLAKKPVNGLAAWQHLYSLNP